MNNILSKSDFKIARSCPTKLYYHKNKYDTSQSDDFMQLLAEGGFYVGKLAQLQHTGGIEIETYNMEFAHEETMRLLKQDQVTIFEATFLVNDIVIRVDILEKVGDLFNLIEVKSKSYDSSNDAIGGNGDYLLNKSGKMIPAWKEYVEDVGFQYMILKKMFPATTIHSFLLLPDKAKRTTIEGLGGMFTINENTLKVEFTGTKEEVLSQDLLTRVDVSQWMQPMLEELEEASSEFSDSVKENIKIGTEININCKGCEFSNPDDLSKSGFHECWKELAEPSPHIFDLYKLGSVRKGALANELISKGKTALNDIDVKYLLNKKGAFGKTAERQNIQLNSKEWKDDSLVTTLDQLEYPLLFIDFETAATALPYHSNMRPYELIAFQWSCHLIRTPGGELEHFEWINTELSFPNFRFAESLMNLIGYKGTPLMWATHENSTLKKIYEQMEERGYSNPEFKKWLEYIVKFDKTDTGQFVDMNRLTLDHYFHPDMGGKTSIKATLPAIWNNNLHLHKNPWFNRFSKIENGKVTDPYKTLESFLIGNEQQQVSHGTAAMRAYDRMLYGLNSSNSDVKSKWKKALLDYCQLDTLAMVIIWIYWKE